MESSISQNKHLFFLMRIKFSHSHELTFFVFIFRDISFSQRKSNIFNKDEKITTHFKITEYEDVLAREYLERKTFELI